MAKKTKEIKTIADLTPDGENFNRHTEFGSKLLEDSLRKFGAGRSVLVDKDGNIIAGNGVVETAASIGMEDVVVVKTDGTKLVVVQRDDLSLVQRDGDIVVRQHLRETLADVVDLNHRLYVLILFHIGSSSSVRSVLK